MNESSLYVRRRTSSRTASGRTGPLGDAGNGVPARGAAPRQPATARAPSAPTALDRYVAAPDPNFTWKVVRELPAEGATATLVEMTSQQWLTDKEVERPLLSPAG
jgi:PhoPQ-activated pathogenicity-related protein